MTAQAMAVPLGLTMTEAHVYTAHYPPDPPQVLPSVTTILGVIGKGEGLTTWAARQAAGWAAANLEAFTRMVADLGPDAAANAAATRAVAIRDAKGDRGTIVHAMAEAVFLRRPVIVPAELQGFHAALVAFVAEHDFQAEHVEAMVYAPEYAGTIDAIGTIRVGRRRSRILLDVKTSNRVYPEMGLQVAAYGAASWIGSPGTLERVAMPTLEGHAILHVSEHGAALIDVEVTERDLEAFWDALNLYQWKRSRALKGGILG